MTGLYDTWLRRAKILAWAGALVAAGAAVHEWLYHRDHPVAPGPSLVLAIGFGAVALVGAAAGTIAHKLERHLELYDRHVNAEAAMLRATVETLERDLDNLRTAVTTNDDIREIYELIESGEFDE